MNPTCFFEPPKYNLEGRQQLWVDGCLFSHDSWCGCAHPAAHLLHCLLPTGHKDRNLSVEALIKKAYNTKWHSGGGTEEESGILATDTENRDAENINPEEDAFGDAALDELLAAAAEDVQPR